MSRKQVFILTATFFISITAACTTEAALPTPTMQPIVAIERDLPSPTHTPTTTPTPSAIPTATVTLTATATPRVTYTPGPLIFQPISLGSVTNVSLTEDFVEPLTGNQVLGDVPFILDGEAFKSQARPVPNNTYSTSMVLEVNLSHVEHVYVLITAGNGFAVWQDETIGQVNIVFDSGALVEVELVLGLNLREWHAVGNVVSYAPDIQQVWEGAIAGHPHLKGTLDMLKIEVPSEYREKTVIQIEFYDRSTSTIGSLDPALTIPGITIAHRSNQ